MCVKLTNPHLVFALVTATQGALHGVTALHSDLSPDHHTRRGFFRAFNYKTAAGQAERWSHLRQQLRQSLKHRTSGFYIQFIYMTKSTLIKSQLLRLMFMLPLKRNYYAFLHVQHSLVCNVTV